MEAPYDAIVVGLGAMGSAAAYHLAKRGARVLGLDRFAPPHTLGSSHGETRVIREAYFEHPVYVPLVQRAYDLWSDLERASGERLYLQTGGVMIGRRDSAVFTGAVRSALEHRLPHEILSAAQISRRAPILRPNSDMAGVLEPRAGILFPERCVAAHLKLAAAAGAVIRVNEPAESFGSSGAIQTVRTHTGSYTARTVVLSAGPWLPKLVPSLAPKLRIERQVLLWFRSPEAHLTGPDRVPIHLWEYEPDRMFYGFPDLGDGLKVAFHHEGEETDAAAADRNVRTDDVTRMRALLRRFLPDAADADLIRGAVCLYTNTADGHFIIDRAPGQPNVILASPCSGHGFKFASAIGEVLADLAENRTPRVDLSLFQMR